MKRWNYYDAENTALRHKLFAHPMRDSALRRASRSNPRNLPCPTCKKPDRLTPADVRRHYQCDECADLEERGW